ncbi:MAG TPA: hypothetical protein VGH20_15645 [Myxococcales bacterium]|jgi:hypothetical protein
MKRAMVVAVALAACSSNPITIGSGQFISPTGLSWLSLADRDLIFVAGTGRDGLRALQVCEGVDSDFNLVATCPNDQQFLPGPVRVFPANIETNNRPLRLAGVRLFKPLAATDAGVADAGTADVRTPTGVVLVVGADETVRVVDAQNIFDAANGNAAASIPLTVVLPGVGVDVVADNPIDQTTDLPTGADTVTAYVATAPSGTTPGSLIRLSVSLNPANGAATAPVQTGQCTLDGIVPSRIALAPREVPATTDTTLTVTGVAQPPTDIFVGDSAGDGVVRVAADQLSTGTTPVPCVTTRVSAGGRSVKALALSPQWYETIIDASGNITGEVRFHPAGELLMMVLNPAATTTPGTTVDNGGVVFADLCTFSSDGKCKDFTGGTLLPIPPNRFDRTDTAGASAEPMEPISPMSSIPSEAAFMIPPRPELATGGCPPPCSAVYVGAPSDAPVQFFSLVAALSSSDGATYFVDVLKRRFVNANFYNQPSNGNLSLIPTFIIPPVFTPASADPNGPVLVQMAADTLKGGVHPVGGWVQAGLTHSSNWRVTWHSVFPGYERIGGTATLTSRGTYLFKSTSDLTPLQNDPVLHFGVGDAVSFAGFAVSPADGSAACNTLVNIESQVPLRFEMTVTAIGADGSLELSVPPTINFNPANGCTVFGAVAEPHTGGTAPWLVVDGFTALGRMDISPDPSTPVPFVAHERRFDYPYDYLPTDPIPLANNASRAADDSLGFFIIGDEPTVPGSQFNFSINSSNAPVFFADAAFSSGFATGVIAYSSFVHRNLIFTAITGNDSVIEAEPEALSTSSSGVQVFR